MAIEAASIDALPRIPDRVPDAAHSVELDKLTATFTQALLDIRSQLPDGLRSPQVGIVCGSGLQGLAELIQDKHLVSYSSIAGFGESTVKGHQSALAFGYLGQNKTPVVCQLGRFHAYEGFPLDQVVYPMRVMKLLGIKVAIITNAAGGLDPQMKVGTIVAVQDHISLPSLTSWNPLIGPNRETLGPRFPPMSDAYDFELRKLAFRLSDALNFPRDSIREGTYTWVAGPTYETKAEQRFLRAAGADVVGMSTIPEVIAARHSGVRVLVLSLVTNIVVNSPYKSAREAVDRERDEGSSSVEDHAQDKEEVANHQEVLDVSARRADDMRALVEKIVDSL
ncbi:Purine nucleoside phosphorylase [Microbotryomycetes sp. JL221]|nr:Purine nucleoside phosphorylase [Microbotryomycetes sp. JL221]